MFANVTRYNRHHNTLSLSTQAGVLALSVVDEESLPDVTDAITVERTTSWAIGNVANIVQVVGAPTVVTLGITTYFQDKRLCDVVVLVTVGACEIITNDFGNVLANFRNGESPHNKATQTEVETAITDQTYDVDG